LNKSLLYKIKAHFSEINKIRKINVILRIRNVSPHGLWTLHPMESRHAYTHSKAREKLTAKCHNQFIKKFPHVLAILVYFKLLPKRNLYVERFFKL
jgi:hypothetical protein